MDERNQYTAAIDFNGRMHLSVLIAQHYKNKHPDMSDDLILSLVQLVDGKQYDPEDEADEDGFQYFVIEPLDFQDKPYRLILTTSETEDFLGVINAFRVEKKK